MPPGIGLRVGAKLLQSSQLATLLEMNTDTASLLRVVQQVAVWVQGNWIVLSDVYAKDIASSINGVPAELMCQDRDYVLYLFPQNQLRVSSVIRLPSEEIKEILEQVNKRWELLLQVDKAFISRFSFPTESAALYFCC
ncbi:DNA-directed RNA polymerase III subunit RPC5-like isoform X2 [Zootermopsis nevadensis]|uniref:DNA-directed RNA polymerase III subunit RPC5-like isoform X2 n=1 Tax=Zootermopsis nevadensis TaxID=136037 RepID=UPI000B8E8A5C|nr:DNA-directed RNA polymerase III subunit RPC5-like isoform X2 [Zootermopsis nevadensis]